MKNNIKKALLKVSGRSVVLSAFYADFCLCPKSVIITILTDIKNAYHYLNRVLYACSVAEVGNPKVMTPSSVQGHFLNFYLLTTHSLRYSFCVSPVISFRTVS